MAYHHQYHDRIERRNDDSSTSSSLVLRDRGCLFSQDVYALLPNVEGQIRAASIQSSSSRGEEFDDRTFKCVFPLRDGGTSFVRSFIKVQADRNTRGTRGRGSKRHQNINIYRVNAIDGQPTGIWTLSFT